MEWCCLVLLRGMYWLQVTDPSRGVYGTGAHTDWGALTFLLTVSQAVASHIALLYAMQRRQRVACP